jgi:hypothetical protein
MIGFLKPLYEVHECYPTSALIGKNPPPTEARLAPGFVCIVYSVQVNCCAKHLYSSITVRSKVRAHQVSTKTL